MRRFSFSRRGMVSFTTPMDERSIECRDHGDRYLHKINRAKDITYTAGVVFDEGVVFIPSPKIESLIVRDCIAKHLPSNVGEFIHLKTIIIRGKSFESLPLSLSSLKSLTYLALCETKVSVITALPLSLEYFQVV